MGYTFQESDWKQFRSRIGGWQENSMRKLITGYIVMLSDDTKSPSEKFWALEEKINDDKKLYGVTCERKRSAMVTNLITLLYEGAITDGDLNGFSEDLCTLVKNSAAARE